MITNEIDSMEKEIKDLELMLNAIVRKVGSLEITKDEFENSKNNSYLTRELNENGDLTLQSHNFKEN